MQTYWVWYGNEFVGLVQKSSQESVKQAFGLDPSRLRVVREDDLTLDDWIEADVQMRA